MFAKIVCFLFLSLFSTTFSAAVNSSAAADMAVIKELQTQLVQLMQTCQKEVGDPGTDLKKMEENTLCVYKCVFEKDGLLDATGKFHPKNTKSTIVGIVGKMLGSRDFSCLEKMEPIKECKNLTNPAIGKCLNLKGIFK